MNQWLQELLAWKEHKELDHWQAKFMFDELSMPKLGQTLKRLNMILILPNCPCMGFLILLFVNIMCLSNLLMANHNKAKLLRFQIHCNFILKREVLCKHK